MSFQKRLFSRIFFLICFCVVLSSLSVPAYASVSETLGINCKVCNKYTTWLLKEYVSYPKCTSPGQVRYSCSECGNLVARAAPALGHDYQETSRIEPAFCASGTSYQCCSRCGVTRSETIPALTEDHAWRETGRTEPTAESEGSITYTCSVCGTTKTESIPKLEGCVHVWKETSRMDPTTELEGSIAYTCSVCGTTKTESIPKLEGCVHDWKETSRRDPTETSFGLIEYTCSICGASRSEVLPALSSGESMMGFEYVIFLFGKVWEMMLNNSLLTIFLVASLVGVGVRLFQRLKSAARL